MRYKREQISDDPCGTCLLDADGLSPVGKKNARFLIVTKAPTAHQLRHGMHMSKDSQKIFIKCMKEEGFDKDDFVFHSSVKCVFDQKKMVAKDRNVVKSCCMEYLHRVIEQVQPDVIVPLGADAASAVMGRQVKITKARGVPELNRKFGCLVLPMLDPSIVSMYPQNQPIFEADCRTLGNLVDFDYDVDRIEASVHGEYEQVDDLQFLIDMNPERLAIDLETMGTRWADKSKKICTMQIAVEPGKAYLVSWDHPENPASPKLKKKLKKQLKQLLQNPLTSVINQNLKFDAGWIFSRLGFRFRIDHDTLMLAALIDENSVAKDQSSLVKRFVPAMAGYDDSFNQKYDKAHMERIPLKDITQYGCGDADSALRLLDVMLPMVKKDPRLYTHYRRVSIPGINAFASIEQRGLRVDPEAIDDFEQTLAESVASQRAALMAQVPRSIRRKHIKAGLKFSRAAFLLDILFYHKDGFRLKPKVYTESTRELEPHLRVPSTSTKDHLPYFFEEEPFTIDLAQYIKDDRLLGTNVRSFRNKYIIDDYIYPIYSLWTAVTGRTASSDPNGQNFPKRGANAKAYRKIFVPPPGYFLLEADLSQAELRIAADMANDKTMLNIYRNNGDIHKATALIVMGLSMEQFSKLPKDEQKLARFKAKAVNFGFLYGMGWRNFIVYAKTQYEVEFTEREAQRIRNQFFEKYAGLPTWHTKMRELVRKNTYVRSYSGRVRHLPMIESAEDFVKGEAERQAINSPVQEFASSLGVMAVSRIEQEISPEYLQIVGFVHDAIYAYVPEKYLQWGAETLKHYMETVPIEEWFGIKMKVPIIADVSFGLNGGESNEMEGLTIGEDYDYDSLDLDFDIPEQEFPKNDGILPEKEYMHIGLD